MSKLKDIMKYVKVSPMTGRSGKAVPNQYVITTPYGDVFQSYDSVICILDNEGNVVLDAERWDYSVTTNKYRTEFLNESTATTRKKIAAGVYQTENLNG